MPLAHSLQRVRKRRTSRSDVEHDHCPTEQDDAAFATVIARVAELELVRALKLEVTCVIAAEADARDRYSIVEEHQSFRFAGPARRLNRRFAHVKTVEPEPGAHGEHDDKNQFGARHWLSSIEPYAGFPYDFRIARDLALDQRGERLGRIADELVAPLRSEPLDDVGHFQSADAFLIKAIDDRTRCSGRCEQALPRCDLI